MFLFALTVQHPADGKQQHTAAGQHRHGPVQLTGLRQTAHYRVIRVARQNGAVWITRQVKHKALYFISNSLVMLIDRNSIVNNMHEAYKRTENMTYDFGAFISGPSKTADIEQALVLGAHGPVKVLVVLK